MRTIRRGNTGDEVKAWQRIIGVEDDGAFGSETEAVTRAWQKARGLVSDGIVGEKSWTAAGVVPGNDHAPPVSVGEIRFIPAKNFSRASRSMGSISAVVIHTAECGEAPKAAAENVAGWFANQPKAGTFIDPKTMLPLPEEDGGKKWGGSSAHYTVDTDSVTQSVRDEDVAWHANQANGWSIGIEHAGYASQTAAQWADADSTAILDRSAELVAGLCKRWGIPVRRLTADDLRRGERAGIFGHVDVTNAFNSGAGHYDPGPSFPWTVYLTKVREKLAALVPSDVATTEAGDEEPPDGWAVVYHQGEVWWVTRGYKPFCSIGEAVEAARAAGCELPSPALADSIWRAADLQISPAEIIQTHDRTVAGMNAPALYARVEAAIDHAVKVHGPWRLMAGAFKDVVTTGPLRMPGLYGWHVADAPAFESRLRARIGGSVPTTAPATPGPGRVVQPVYTGHALAWRDYSQGFRLCRRKS